MCEQIYKSFYLREKPATREIDSEWQNWNEGVWKVRCPPFSPLWTAGQWSQKVLVNVPSTKHYISPNLANHLPNIKGWLTRNTWWIRCGGWNKIPAWWQTFPWCNCPQETREWIQIFQEIQHQELMLGSLPLMTLTASTGPGFAWFAQCIFEFHFLPSELQPCLSMGNWEHTSWDHPMMADSYRARRARFGTPQLQRCVGMVTF